MRNLTKLDQPQILVEEWQNWTQELLATQPRSRAAKEVEKRYGHRTIKNQLRTEVRKKCAYCESAIEAVAYAHIEHIRPKAHNRELTFVWTNLTLACPICNNNKGDDEPTGNNFVNPYHDQPEEKFEFVGSIMTPIVLGDLPARNMINWLDLNRGDLVVSRAEVVNRVLGIYEQAVTLPLDARREFITLSLRPLKSPDHPYSRVATCAEQTFEAHFAQALAI